MLKVLEMKIIVSLIFLLLSTLSVHANEYTDKLTVTVNGSGMEQQATISITQDNEGKYTLALNNFCLESTEEDGTVTRIGVGNIVLSGIEGVTTDGITSITYNDGIYITAGDDPDVAFWMGPTLAELGPVPIEMEARFNNTQLYCVIHINLVVLDQVIDVVFGTPEFTNGIGSIRNTATTQHNNQVYDLSGRKVTSLNRRSLYIIDGKKVMIH